MLELDRRQFVGKGGLWSALAAFGIGVDEARGAGGRPDLGPPYPFDFNRLRQRARALAAKPYARPPSAASDLVRAIDFDKAQAIGYRAEYELWRNGPGRFPVRFFHLNKYAVHPVGIHVVAAGQARALRYAPRYFDYGDPKLKTRLPNDLGFAGFRLMDGRDARTDWLAFLGASYFRSSGDTGQYGASARGIAVDTALPKPEEFPRFTDFWLAPGPDGKSTVTIYALLDGESMTGAYRFDAARADGAVIDVHAELFFRRKVGRLGIAPLTSMFWYGENERRGATDWRPEIHDSDGLAIWTGAGERIWRPLVNPPTVKANLFLDTDPKGFGIVQRDRAFNNYLDDGAFYDRRPSIWIEPRGSWGKGAVVLVEIPTDDEIHDNIVAFWQPAVAVERGTALTFDYRTYWRAATPHPAKNAAHVVATRIGHGGVPGQRPRPTGTKKFVIDFEGGPLDTMRQRYDVTPVVTVSRGRVQNPYVVKVVSTKHWRAVFDLEVSGGEKPVDLRCYLRLGDKTLSETWIYQYHATA